MSSIGAFFGKNMKNICWRLSNTAIKTPQRLLGTVPDSPESSILTQVMQTEEKDSNLKLTTLSLEKPCSYDDNYMSRIQKASVVAKKSDGRFVENRFALKIQLQDEKKRSVYSTDKVWANEEYMYKQVIPALKKASQCEMYVPKYYYSDPSTIVLEDLSHTGYKTIDRIRGFSFTQAMMVLNRLAHFHAASLALQYKDKSFFNAIKENHRHPFLTTESQEKTGPLIKKSIMKAAEVLKNDDDANSYSKAISFLQELADKQADVVRDLHKMPSGDSAVVIHGDLWINNILLLEDPIKDLTNDVKFVDFQASRMGSVAADLHHVIFTSVQPHVRREILGGMVQCYHKNQIRYLKQFMRSSDDSYVGRFTLERLFKEFNNYRLSGFLNGILFLSETTIDGKKEPKDINMDSNAIANGYRNKLKTLIDEFVERDWLKFD